MKTGVDVQMNSTHFKRSGTEINRLLRLMDSEFKKTKEQAKQFGETSETLSSKQKSLSEKVSLQTAKMAKLADKIKAVKEKKGEDSKETQNLTVQYNNMERKLISMQGQLVRANKQLKEFKEKAKGASKETLLMAQKLKASGEKLKNVGGQMQKVGLGITAIMLSTAKFAMDFEDSMAKVDTIADTTFISIESLGQGVRNMAVETGESTDILAEALYQAISAGVETGESLEYIRDSSNLAIGGFTDTATAVDILTTIMNSYGKETFNAKQISDQLFATQKKGKLTIGELAAGMGDVIPLASQLGISTEDLFASLAGLTKQGIKADKAITAMRGVLSGLVNPTAEAEAMAKKLGIEIGYSAIQSQGLGKFLERLTRKTKNNKEAIGALFGNVKTFNAILALTSSNGMKEYKEALDAITNSNGETDKAMSKMNTTSRKVKKSIADLKNKAIELGESLLPMVTGLTAALKPFAELLGMISPSAYKVIAAFGISILVFGTLIKTVGVLCSTFSILIPMIATVTGINLTFNASMFATVGVIIAVVAAVALLVYLLAMMVGQQKEVENGMKGMANTAKETGSKIKGNMGDLKAPKIEGSFATGLNEVPRDMTAQIHKGEAIIPANQNPFNPNAEQPFGSTGGNTYKFEEGSISINAKDIEEMQSVFEFFNTFETAVRQGV